MRTCLLALLPLAVASHALAAPRDVQIRSVNFATDVIEIHNFGAAAEDIGMYQFCTHDTDQVRRYSFPFVPGTMLPAGGSIFIHWRDDAPFDPAHFNRSDIGGNWAVAGAGSNEIDPGAFGLGLYFPPVNFSNGNQIADHLQLSLNGDDNASADARTTEAVNGGVWTDETAWIATGVSTMYIRLNDLTGGVLHGPDDYDVLQSIPDCNNNDLDDLFEILAGLPDQDMNGVPDECEDPCPGDLTTTGASMGDPAHGTPDGVTDLSDLLLFVNVWTTDLGNPTPNPGTIADTSTTGAGEGDPGFGQPDSNVDIADLLFFVNVWLEGLSECPG